MTMSYFPFKKLYSFECRNNWIRIMSCCYNNIIKVLNSVFFKLQVSISDLKFRNLLKVFDVSSSAIEFDIFSKSFSLKSFHKVSFKYLSWQVSWDWFSKMIFKGIVRKLEALFGKISPKLTIHAWMNMFSIFISSSSPCVIPLSTPLGLFLNTNNFVFF